MGMHQNNLLAKPFFALVHFHALQTFFVVLLLIDDIHIFNHASFVPLTFDHFGSQLDLVGLAI
jgi:hypothetical protein